MSDPAPCPTCGVDYRPDRTDGACPVCRTRAPGAALTAPAPLDRRVLVVAVSAVDFLALAAVAWWLFG